MDSFATAISLALQHGVPLKVLCEKFAHTRFEPSGWTGNEEIGYAKSIMDYLFRWMQLRFLSGQQLDLFADLKQPTLAAATSSANPATPALGLSFRSAAEESASPSSGEPHGQHPATHELHGEAFHHTDRTPPQQGIARDLSRPRRHGSVILRRRRRTCF